jgi:hypothetical protein
MKPAAEWVDTMVEHWPSDENPLSDDERKGIARFFEQIQEDAARDLRHRAAELVEASSASGVYRSIATLPLVPQIGQAERIT